MIKVTNRTYGKLTLFLTVLIMLLARLVQAQSNLQAYETGKTIFNTQCGTCHSIHKEILGPMLASVTKKHTEGWLINFIINSQEVILSGDQYAQHLFEKYNHTVMPSFGELSKDEIRDVLLYVKSESELPTGDWPTFASIDLNYNDNNVSSGKQLFNNACSICHFIGKEGKGPSLGSVPKRLPRSWLVSFIQNSQEVIKNGDPYAMHLYKSYDQQVMPPFDFLSEDEIMSILDYIEFESASPSSIGGANGRKIKVKSSVQQVEIDRKIAGKGDNTVFTIASILILIAGASIQAYLIVRLFKYLLNG